MNNDPSLLVLKDVKVLFSEFNKDSQYGRSITIDATDPSVQQKIADWYGVNEVGKIKSGRNANASDYDGKPKFREYNDVKQFTFKLNKNTDPAFTSEIEGASLKDVRYTAKINLVAQAFKFNNQFGNGISESVVAIKLVGMPEGIDQEKMLELL